MHGPPSLNLPEWIEPPWFCSEAADGRFRCLAAQGDEAPVGENDPQRPLPAPPNNRAVGLAVVKRFEIPEGKSEVSHLSRFYL